jgi:endonuclease IV
MFLGVHVAKESHVLDVKKSIPLDEAIKRDIDALKLNALQIFVYGPQSLIPNKINIEKISQLTEKLSLSVHSAYPTTGIWKINKNNIDSKESKNKILSLSGQLKLCKEIGAWGLVVHISRVEPESVAETMELLKYSIKKEKVTLVLEMIATKSHTSLSYETPEKINYLTSLIKGKYWVWCVDTAHIWGCGVDITSYDNMKKWLDAIDKKDKIKMFHLNGSSSNLGDGKDKHEIIFSKNDNIWYGIEPKKSGVRAIIEFAKKYNVDVIMEINRGAEKDTRNAIDIINDF